MIGATAASLLVDQSLAQHTNVPARVTNLIVKHMGVERSKVTPAASFKALGADSLDCVELTMAAEEEFNIVVHDDVAAKIRTVGEMIRHIEATPKAPPRAEQKAKK